MDVEKLIKDLRIACAGNQHNIMGVAATAITDLLARAEAAEDRAEKAEKCITEIEEALKFQRYSASMFFISEYRGQKEE